MVAGPLRAELTADGVALADDRFEFRIIAAVRAAPGAAWLFLGPLEPPGPNPGR